jgi:hypothetical protein
MAKESGLAHGTITHRKRAARVLEFTLRRTGGTNDEQMRPAKLPPCWDGNLFYFAPRTGMGSLKCRDYKTCVFRAGAAGITLGDIRHSLRQYCCSRCRSVVG